MAKKIGLIGCGIWGANILRDLGRLGARVTVVDRSEAARERARAAGWPTHGSLDALPSVDGIIVATPASTHVDVVSRLLDRGVPIFTEKPFTLDMPSAERLAAAAPDRLFVMHVWRYHPGVEVLRDIVRNEDFGSVEWIRSTRANWTSPRTDVDSIWTMAPHDLSIALEILGDLPKPVAAVAERIGGAPTGLVATLGDKPPFVLETSTRYPAKRRDLRVHCRDAVLVMTGADPTEIEIFRVDETDPRTPIRSTTPIPPGSALMRELATFLRFLDGGPAPRSGMADALRITSTMIALRHKAGLDAQ